MLCAALAGAGKFQSCWAVYVVAMRRAVPLRYTSYLAVMTAALRVSLHPRACSAGGACRAWEAGLGAARLLSSAHTHFRLCKTLSVLQAARYGNALRAFEDIQATGMQPNVVTYCSIVSGLARSRQEGFVRSAHKLWRELQRSGQHLDAAAYRTGENLIYSKSRLHAKHCFKASVLCAA
jgi:hypothetical protein